MNKTKQTFVVALEIIFNMYPKRVRMGCIKTTELLSDVFFQSVISEVTTNLETHYGRKPDLVSVKVYDENQELIDSKSYSFEWMENNTFQLLQNDIEVDGDLINLSPDVEVYMKEAASNWKEKELLEKIDEALDNKDEETFMNLTTELLELRKGSSNE